MSIQGSKGVNGSGYVDPTVNSALKNMAETARTEYIARHQKRSPSVVRYGDETPAVSFGKYVASYDERKVKPTEPDADPTADTALRNLAEQAQLEYEERHRKKSPSVVHYSDKKQSFIDFMMNGKPICPKCGSANLDKLGLEPGDHPWMLCRDCGEVIESE